MAATSRDGVEGVRRAIDTVVTGPSRDAALHFFAVGVQTYKDPALRLRHGAADAANVAEALAERARPVFKRGVFVAPVLTDQLASLGGIERGFEELVKQVRPQDTLVIFLAGHGEAPIGQGYTFLPWDFERAAAGPAAESGNVLDDQRLQRWLERSSSPPRPEAAQPPARPRPGEAAHGQGRRGAGGGLGADGGGRCQREVRNVDLRAAGLGHAAAAGDQQGHGGHGQQRAPAAAAQSVNACSAAGSSFLHVVVEVTPTKRPIPGQPGPPPAALNRGNLPRGGSR